MTNRHFSLILLAVLTALMLAGCGQLESSSQESSETIEMQTWGEAIDPAATPSMGQVMPDILTPAETDAPQSSGAATIDGQDDETDAPAPTAEATATATPTATTKPSSGSNSGTSTATPSPSNSPSIAPPAPASSATIDAVQGYVGRTLTELIDELGYPLSSDYQLVDEEDPDQGEKGVLYFNGFTATTLRKDGTETVTSVIPDATPSEEPSEPPES